jgi:hypothetical protein
VFAGGAVTSCWLSCQAYSSVSGTVKIVGLGKSGTLLSVLLGQVSTGKLGIYKYDGTTLTELAAETGTLFLAYSIHKVDMQIISLGASTEINVWVDGTLVIEYTGDPRPTGLTEFDIVTLFGSDSMFSSEIIVASEDTRLMSLKTLAPGAAGDTSDWTGAYTDIDETTLSDADTIYTADAAVEFNANLTGMPTGTFICKGVKVSARAADGVGGLTLATGVRTNSTTDLGTPVTLEGAWETIEKLYQTNPVTSNRFTPAEIEALQIALETAAA